MADDYATWNPAAEQDWEDDPVCPRCGGPTMWQDCDKCGGAGGSSPYEYSPIEYDPDEWDVCDQCDGEGGWNACMREERCVPLPQPPREEGKPNV